MNQICELFRGLKDNFSELTDSTHVVSLPLSSRFLLGITKIQTPVFFIECELKNYSADLNLEYISVMFNKKCSLIDDSNRKFSKVYTVITLNQSDCDFQNYFLEVVYLILQKIPKKADGVLIKKEIDKILQLFSYTSLPAAKSVQGLWAGLLVIEQSESPEYLIKSWHSHANSRFDFNDGKDKLEVKSTSLAKRVHDFSLDQLKPNENSKLIIASVFALETTSGKNINDLRKMIFEKVSNIETQSLMDSIVFKVLGNEISKSLDFYFDYQLAVDELKFFDSGSIPKIENIPAEISNVKFSCDLSNIKSLSKNELKKIDSVLFRGLL